MVLQRYLRLEPTELNFLEALVPSRVTAAMHTTAMSATKSAYSTRDAPLSVWQRAVSHDLKKVYETIISGYLPTGRG
jgi:hypothetical protein